MSGESKESRKEKFDLLEEGVIIEDMQTLVSNIKKRLEVKKRTVKKYSNYNPPTDYNIRVILSEYTALIYDTLKKQGSIYVPGVGHFGVRIKRRHSIQYKKILNFMSPHFSFKKGMRVAVTLSFKDMFDMQLNEEDLKIKKMLSDNFYKSFSKKKNKQKKVIN